MRREDYSATLWLNDTLRHYPGRRNSPRVRSHLHCCVIFHQCQATPTTRTQHLLWINNAKPLHILLKRYGWTKERSLKCSDNQKPKRHVGVDVPAGLFNGRHESPAPSAFPDTFSPCQMFSLYHLTSTLGSLAAISNCSVESFTWFTA